jgi:hypothetical protein
MWLRPLGLSLTMLALAACGASREIGADERLAIDGVLDAYAQAMADAYRSGDANRIDAVATGRERHRLEISIRELADEGRALRPELRSLTIESIERAGHTSVAVNTLEVWDLRVVTLGTEQLVSESLEQENRLTYSLIREEGQWRVLSRLLRTSSAGS